MRKIGHLVSDRRRIATDVRAHVKSDGYFVRNHLRRVNRSGTRRALARKFTADFHQP